MKASNMIVTCILLMGLVPWVSGETKQTLIPEETLGLCKVGVEADSGLKEQSYQYQGTAPGAGNKRIPRAYDNCPPMIPHDVTDLVPITRENNSCIGCHMPAVATDMGAIPIPKTHLTNLRTNKDLHGELYQGRWNCTQCHAPQAVLDPAVNNRFKGSFHKLIGGAYKSNLYKTLREGVVEDQHGLFNLDEELDKDDK